MSVVDPIAASTPRRIVIARTVALLLVAGTLAAVPAVNLVWGYQHWLLWHWKLYSGHHIGACDAEWYVADESAEAGQTGHLRPVDRARAHGVRSLYELPRKTRSVKYSGLAKETKFICASESKRMGKPADIRLDARCAARNRWFEIEMRKHNLCSAEGRKKLQERVQMFDTRKDRRDFGPDGWGLNNKRGS